MVTLAIAVVCERMRLAMGNVSGILFTLGGSWSMVWGNLDLVRHSTGSYGLVMDGSDVGIGGELGFGMATLGGASGGRSSWGRRIWSSI